MEKNINPNELTVRARNILKSPNKGGNSDTDSISYLEELGVKLVTNNQPIQFFDNRSELVHRWAPYVQGFSAVFVQGQFDRYQSEYSNPVILDPFAGCGTVLVQSKINGFESYGTELNPLLQFVSNTKLNSWHINPEKFVTTYESLDSNKLADAPAFLKSDRHFNKKVLENLQLIKGRIDQLDETNEEEKAIQDLLLVAFSSILIDCSNLVRSPCLGYSTKKKVDDDAPFRLMKSKLEIIRNDLATIQKDYPDKIKTSSNVFLANAKEFEHGREFDLIITSPPYMNGLDYVMNYKIEMGWLGFADNHKTLKNVKDEMVVCDNVSKGLIYDFSNDKKVYSNSWLDSIKIRIAENILKRGSYRRPDMPNIVHKYFDDMYNVMKKVSLSMKSNSRFILVVGDSLIADAYLPTDLLIAKIGQDLGLEIEGIEKARVRRSGQIRSYKLRESIVILRK